MRPMHLTACDALEHDANAYPPIQFGLRQREEEAQSILFVQDALRHLSRLLRYYTKAQVTHMAWHGLWCQGVVCHFNRAVIVKKPL